MQHNSKVDLLRALREHEYYCYSDRDSVICDLLYIELCLTAVCISLFLSDLRLKFMTALMLIVFGVSITITILRFGVNPLWSDHFIPELSTHYHNSAMFAAFYALLNFYMFTMAFVYSPSKNAMFGWFNKSFLS
jgi:Wnt-binding factor required for Wnt secretion